MCMHACIHACVQAAIILLGAEQDPETSTFHSVDRAMGERERRRRGGGGFKELQGCKSQRNMLKSGCTAYSPIHTHTISLAPLQTSCCTGCFFSTLSHSAVKALQCDIKASYDCHRLSLWSLIFFALGSVLKMSIYLVNLGLPAS